MKVSAFLLIFLWLPVRGGELTSSSRKEQGGAVAPPISESSGKVTCLPVDYLNNEFVSGAKPYIVRLRTYYKGFEDFRKVVKDRKAKSYFDTFLAGDEKPLISPKKFLTRVGGLMTVRYLVGKVNDHCDGKIGLYAKNIKDEHCYIHLGLLEYKIMAIKKYKDGYGGEPLDKEDITLPECDRRWRQDLPFINSGVRG